MQKVHSFLLVPAALLGFALAWAVKPNSEVPASAGATPPKVERDRRENSGSDAESPASPKVETRTMVIGGDSESMTPEMREAQDRMATAMEEQHRKKDERRISELVAALGLDAGQEAELRTFFDKRRRALTAMWAGGDAEKGMEAMREDKLDDFLADLLSPDQHETYDELKATERSREVEAAALKDLAGITRSVDLRPDQRDAVYDILHKEAAERIERRAESGQGSMMTMFGNEIGFGSETDFMDFSGVFEGMDEGNGEVPDQQAIVQRIREAQQKKIDEQVGRFEGVLDEGQLTKYRETLESKASMFGAMLEAGE
ncbi:hypothetical protein [Haloferula helveola]